MRQRLAAVGEMAAGIAHEIQKSARVDVRIDSDPRQELPLTVEQEQLMDIVLRESDRLNTTIKSFLAYARPQRFSVTRFDLRRAAERRGAAAAQQLRSAGRPRHRSGRAVRTRSGTKPTKVRSSRSSGIWPPMGCAPCPTAAVCASRRADEKGGGVVLTVQDEGIGIRVRRDGRLFQPFHGSFAKGSGLGLAIVHRIVTDYKGEIEISSRKGMGTRVSVRLPARDRGSHDMSVPRTSRPAAAEPRAAAHSRRRR